MIKSEGVDKLLKIAHERKSPDKIKKELEDKKERPLISCGLSFLSLMVIFK